MFILKALLFMFGLLCLAIASYGWYYRDDIKRMTLQAMRDHSNGIKIDRHYLNTMK